VDHGDSLLCPQITEITKLPKLQITNYRRDTGLSRRLSEAFMSSTVRAMTGVPLTSRAASSAGLCA
jgi:hypothetical protein